MIVLPAIDLRDGACVQLVGGDFEVERVRLPDAVAQLRAFRAQGFSSIHVVDLDAATGRGDNEALVARLLAEGGDVQVGGGVRTLERAKALIDAGAARVVAGTQAVSDRSFREALAAAFPDRVVVALDVRDRQVLVRGWAEGSGRDVTDLLLELAELPLAGVLVTAVHREGKMEGPDVALVEDLTRASPLRIVASGGVGSVEDLRSLARAGASAAVVGMALYTDALDPRAVAEEFSRW